MAAAAHVENAKNTHNFVHTEKRVFSTPGAGFQHKFFLILIILKLLSFIY